MRSCHGHSVVGAGLRYRLKKLQLHVAAGAFRSTRYSLKVLRIRAATYIALARARSSPAAVITVRVTVDVADEPVFTANDLY